MLLYVWIEVQVGVAYAIRIEVGNDTKWTVSLSLSCMASPNNFSTFFHMIVSRFMLAKNVHCVLLDN